MTACSGDTQQSAARGAAGAGGQSNGGSASHAGSTTLGPNVAIDDFPRAYADGFCQLLDRCYTAAAAAIMPDCTTYFERLFREQNFLHIASAVADGRLEYHSDAVAACLEEISSASCDIALLEHCPRVFVGSKKTGEACTLDLECADQQCLVNGACPGACAPLAALDATCTNENRCAPELACQGDLAGSRNCVRTAKLGEACSKSLPCRGYTFCSGRDPEVTDDTGVCVNRSSISTAQLDEPCEPISEPLCEPSLVCTTRVEAGVTVGSCQPRVASGSACTFSIPDACPDAEYCHITSEVGVKPATGSCTPKPGLGEECYYGSFSLAPCAGDDQFCDLDTKLCAQSQHLDAACAKDEECYSNRCSAAGKCVALLECEKSAEP